MRDRRLIAGLLAALIGAAVAATVAAPAAVAQTLPLAHDFGVLLPGQSRSISHLVDVKAPSRVVNAHFEATGDAQWTAELCDDAHRCRAVEKLNDAQLDPGSYRLVIGLRMTDESTSTTASADGMITLSETGVSDESILPATGGAIPTAVILAAGTLIAGGTAVLILTRRRHSRAEERKGK